MKYILVTGGVISGIGKGVISSSLGTLLKSYGLRVAPIKIDPYINIDAGTFSPYEHGEVFVLDDGGEVDLDLGNYERFLDVTLHRDNNITTGKIYQEVITKERRGDYLGKTVQVVPHITEAIQNWVERVAQIPVDNSNCVPDVCIIELGGTVGDIEGMPFVEAFRQFQFRVKRENFCNIHVSLVPQPKSTGEQKTKPTQNSVRELRGLGLLPDFVFCRSPNKLSESVREKISMFCNIEPKQVVSVPDVTSVYHVPVMFDDDCIIDLFKERLNLVLPTPQPRLLMTKWRDIAERHDATSKSVTICLVGKYTQLEDSYLSVNKALMHAALACSLKLVIQFVEADDLEASTQADDPVKYHDAWQRVCSADGILVPGGFGNRGIEGKILACNWARKTKRPFLGVCLGLQCAVIEFARSVLSWKDANSTEFDPKTGHPVVIEMPEHNTGQMGGTMRLGLRTTLFSESKESALRKLYGNVNHVDERHRHRYEVNPDMVSQLEAQGLQFVGQDVDGRRMEIFELTGHPYYVGVQYHPEYLSRPLKPSPPYLGLILAASGKLDAYLARGCRFSPRQHYYNGDMNGFEHSSEEEEPMLSSTTVKSNNASLCDHAVYLSAGLNGKVNGFNGKVNGV